MYMFKNSFYYVCYRWIYVEYSMDIEVKFYRIKCEFYIIGGDVI